ncbi:hypothetical protein ABZ352_18615 [Streptomyces griseofuscus]|uniref:hypothetical protein n=1 Tax=Streptomyces griseofuscus TaxID=146922 RepID=UPI0033C594EB
MTAHDPADLEEQVEATLGRKAPYSRIPDWVTLHPDVEPQAVAVYCVLAAHVNISRSDSLVWPSRLAMAEMLGYSRPQSVDKYIKQLEAIGAIDTEDFTRPNGAKGKRYTVHETPPDDFDGVHTLAAWYKRRRDALAAAGGAAKPGRPRKAQPAAPAPSEPRRAKKAAPAKKAAARKKAAAEKSPEELLLDQRARKGADLWWETAKELVEKKRMGPLMGSPRARSGYYLNLVTRIKEALDAGYDSKVILQALESVGEWSPSKRELDRQLRRLTGVVPPRSGRGGRTPMFTNDQWDGKTPDGAPAASTAPDLDVFGVESDDAA